MAANDAFFDVESLARVHGYELLDTSKLIYECEVNQDSVKDRDSVRIGVKSLLSKAVRNMQEESSNSLSSSLEYTCTQETTTSFTVTKGIRIGARVSVTAGFPAALIGANFQLDGRIDFSKASKQEVKSTQSFKETITHSVNPQTASTLDASVKVKPFSKSFTTTVKLKGSVKAKKKKCMKLRSKTEEYKIEDLLEKIKAFQSGEFKKVEENGETLVKYTASGIIEGDVGIQMIIAVGDKRIPPEKGKLEILIGCVKYHRIDVCKLTGINVFKSI